jgi:hypothetical protein
MATAGFAVFVFSDDPLPQAFRSLADAEGYMEAIDVENGEYEAIYTLDGRVVTAATASDRVVLTVSAERDEDDLDGRLREWAKHAPELGDLLEDRVAVANRLLLDEWAVRWPKRPKWLARRLHGDEPPQIGSGHG